jgi:hypothetical protein
MMIAMKKPKERTPTERPTQNRNQSIGGTAPLIADSSHPPGREYMLSYTESPPA